MILKMNNRRHVLYILLLAAFMLSSGCKGRESGHIRQGSVHAGGADLQVEHYLDKASVEPPEEERLVALVVPEGRSSDAYTVAAYGFKALADLKFDTVVLVGQAHGPSFAGASIYKEGALATPFGPLSVDRQLARRLIGPGVGVVFDPRADKGEFASDILLGFLKRIGGDCKVVLILIGRPNRGTYEQLVSVLATVLTKRWDRRVLLVAMTDLSKGMPYDAATESDARTVASLKGVNAARTQGLLRQGEARLSSGHAALLVMDAARRAGADTAEVFRFTTEKGEDGSGTGHVSVGFYDRPMGDAERVELLTMARRTVEAAVRGEEYDPARVESPRLLEQGAAFVTLEKNRRLRGGMGEVQASGPLYRSVITSARAAAMEDDRFSPMSARELDELNYEVSVLTPLVPVLDARRDIELGTHGLYLQLNEHGGMLLPQVPVEQRWDLDEYLRQISLRAGLPPDAWKEKGARLWSFTTEIVH